MTSLAIIVVSYNTRDRTLACLRSVLREPAGVPTEVIVVDNDSHDGSADAIEREVPSATVIRSDRNLGFARGVNLGADRASAEYLLLLNPDTVVLPGSLAALLNFALTHPRHGIYGGRTLHEDGTLDPSSCWGAPTLWSLTCFALGLSTAFPGSSLFDPESLGRWQRNSVRTVPIVTGCLLLVRRDRFLDLGGLDPRYFLYGEDAEFSLRARGLGLRPVIVPEAQIIHAVGASTGARGPKMSMIMAGKVTMLRSLWPTTRARIGIALMVVGVALRAGLESVTRRRDRMWVHVWRTRSRWLPGYPAAERTLFGLEAVP